jgi:hypothetical protein
MNLHAVFDGALGCGRLPAAVSGWRNARVSHAHFVLAFGRELAGAVRDSIRRRASQTRIHVPPMSDTWLRMHEADDGKRPAEL